MIFNTKPTQKNASQKLNGHYLLNELWSDLDESSQAAVSGGSYSLSFTCTANSSSSCPCPEHRNGGTITRGTNTLGSGG